MANVYGQTESSVNSICLIKGDQRYRKPIIGTPLEETEIFVIDDKGRPVETLETGEILVACKYISPGYWKNPETLRHRTVTLTRPRWKIRRLEARSSPESGSATLVFLWQRCAISGRQLLSHTACKHSGAGAGRDIPLTEVLRISQFSLLSVTCSWRGLGEFASLYRGRRRARQIGRAR